MDAKCVFFKSLFNLEEGVKICTYFQLTVLPKI